MTFSSQVVVGKVTSAWKSKAYFNWNTWIWIIILCFQTYYEFVSWSQHTFTKIYPFSSKPAYNSKHSLTWTQHIDPEGKEKDINHQERLPSTSQRPPRHDLCSRRDQALPGHGILSLLLTHNTAALRLCRWSSFWGKLSSAGEQGEMLESKGWLSGAQGIWKATEQEQEAQGGPSYSA